LTPKTKIRNEFDPYPYKLLARDMLATGLEKLKVLVERLEALNREARPESPAAAQRLLQQHSRLAEELATEVQWITSNDSTFVLYCDFLGIDAEAVRDRMEGLVARATSALVTEPEMLEASPEAA